MKIIQYEHKTNHIMQVYYIAYLYVPSSDDMMSVKLCTGNSFYKKKNPY